MPHLGETRYLVAVIGVVAGLVASQGPAAADTFTASGFATETIATFPPYTLVGMAFAPDGRLFVWQKNGVVRVIKNGQLLPTPFIDLSAKVNTFDDRGFWGLAFDPQFATNGYVYMSYTFENAGNPNSTAARTSRLTRVTAERREPRRRAPGNRDRDPRQHRHPALHRPARRAPTASRPTAARTRSARCTSPPTARSSSASATAPTAAFADPSSLRAQDLDSPNGKILRIRTDGSAPPDNPFYDGTNSWRSRVWLYGVRNPFGFTLHPGDRGDLLRRRRMEHVGGGQPRLRGPRTSAGRATRAPGRSRRTSRSSRSARSCRRAPSRRRSTRTTTQRLGGDRRPDLHGHAVPAGVPRQLLLRRLLRQLHPPGRARRPAPAGLARSCSRPTSPAPVSIAQGPDGMLYYLSFTTGEVRRIRFNGVVADAVRHADVTATRR